MLRLGYAWAAIGRHTTPLLRRWSGRHPDIELQLVRHNTPTSGLIEGHVDAAVVRTPVAGLRLDSVVVGLERRLVAFAADDPQWRRRRSLRMAEIAQRTVVIDPRTGTTTSELWQDGSPPTRFIHSGDVDEWLDAIAAGQGVGVTAEATAAHHSRPGVVFRPVADGPPIPVHLAWWQASPPPGLTDLIDEVADLYRATHRPASKHLL
ncbi:LysR family substrate-binding domain-containing protein [Pseudonocardia lutea]|uniref:LysR family substrate-binding domain-containing protein n=1 Tax=Pseudonocardia lutea TaxID=2172015 RepID=A0ABW1IED8_9PSEU